jgi:hypothetical protein
MSVKIVSVIILASIFLFILELIRQEKLTFKYAFGWMLAIIGGFIIIFAEAEFQRFSLALGFKLLSNFIFFCCMGIAVVLGLLLTVLLSQQDRRNELMAKKIAMLEHEIQDRM